MGSYLNNRKQRIKLGEYLSDSMSIPDGVPQDSTLGPTLFLCYINDLKHLQFSSFINLYADDTCFTFSSVNKNDVITRLNDDLDLFYKWCLSNKLTINIKKTKVLPYYSNRQGNFISDNQIKTNNKGLECDDSYTYLGIKVDSGLTMTKNIDHLFRSALTMMFTLYKIRPYIDTRTAILIFKAHVLSRIECGSVFCIGANKSSLDRLQKLVNRSLCICLKRLNDSNVL